MEISADWREVREGHRNVPLQTILALEAAGSQKAAALQEFCWDSQS